MGGWAGLRPAHPGPLGGPPPAKLHRDPWAYMHAPACPKTARPRWPAGARGCPEGPGRVRTPAARAARSPRPPCLPARPPAAAHSSAPRRSRRQRRCPPVLGLQSCTVSAAARVCSTSMHLIPSQQRVHFKGWSAWHHLECAHQRGNTLPQVLQTGCAKHSTWLCLYCSTVRCT